MRIVERCADCRRRTGTIGRVSFGVIGGVAQLRDWHQPSHPGTTLSRMASALFSDAYVLYRRGRLLSSLPWGLTMAGLVYDVATRTNETIMLPAR
jgi:hypothetical protein